MSKSFSFTEFLVVIATLAILLFIVLLAINPARQFSQANNAKRRADVNSVLEAIKQYSEDNKTFKLGIASTLREISSTGVNLCAMLVPSYLAALPVDPKINDGVSAADCSSPYDTGYVIIQNPSNNRITVSAPNAELGEVISATR